MTPDTTATSYFTAASLLKFVDWRVVADLAADADGPRPTRRALADADSDAGAVVAEHMLAACGEFESAVRAGNRYGVADLAALAGAGGRYRDRLLASLTHWSMAQRREPAAADPEQVPGAAAALAVLGQLRQGERVLSFAEAAAAGGGPTPTPTYDAAAEPGGGRAVTRAGRLFSTRE
jgi:hypothetical protein